MQYLVEDQGKIYLQANIQKLLITFFDTGKCSVSIRVTQKDDIDLDKIVDFDLVSGTKNLSNFNLS